VADRHPIRPARGAARRRFARPFTPATKAAGEAGYGLETEVAQLDGAFIERAGAAQAALAERYAAR
jgi:ATP-dependent DNA helicase DinG